MSEQADMSGKKATNPARFAFRILLLLAALIVVGVLVWQGITAGGNPERSISSRHCRHRFLLPRPWQICSALSGRGIGYSGACSGLSDGEGGRWREATRPVSAMRHEAHQETMMARGAAIFRERDGALTPLVNGIALRGMTDLDVLIEFVRERANGPRSSRPE